MVNDPEGILLAQIKVLAQIKAAALRIRSMPPSVNQSPKVLFMSAATYDSAVAQGILAPDHPAVRIDDIVNEGLVVEVDASVLMSPDSVRLCRVLSIHPPRKAADPAAKEAE